MKILVINPGSTSTKWAVYNDRTLTWRATRQHTVDELSQFKSVSDQEPMRAQATLKALEEAGIEPRFDVVIARGGLLKPTPSGVYRVDELVAHDLRHSPLEHACNLGGLMALDIANSCGCPALIADPEVVDEMSDLAHFTGLPQIRRRSIFHALNTKAVARSYAASVGLRYEDLNLILVHLGGGISVGAHLRGQVVDVNNALNGDGPFSPERAGTLPADQLVELCFSGQYTERQIKQMLNGAGGLSAHLGSNDVAAIARRAQAGEQPYKRVLDAMIYSVAKEIGAKAVVLKGRVDAIILTGGIAHSHYCVNNLTPWVEFIAPIVVRAGEDELDSLAYNAYQAITGAFPLQSYNPNS